MIDRDEGDEHRPSATLVICAVGGCIDPDNRGHRNECIMSAEWLIVGDVDVTPYFQLHARLVGMEAALGQRGYEARLN